MKFREKEILKYERTVNYIRQEMADDRDFNSSLGSVGLNFADDIRRFREYTEQFGVNDIKELLDNLNTPRDGLLKYSL